MHDEKMGNLVSGWCPQRGLRPKQTESVAGTRRPSWEHRETLSQCPLAFYLRPTKYLVSGSMDLLENMDRGDLGGRQGHVLVPECKWDPDGFPVPCFSCLTMSMRVHACAEGLRSARVRGDGAVPAGT